MFSIGQAPAVTYTIRSPESFWNAPLQDTLREIKLMVKRVFITSDMGEGYLPKWASWLKAVVDADDLPLTVGAGYFANEHDAKTYFSTVPLSKSEVGLSSLSETVMINLYDRHPAATNLVPWDTLATGE